MPWIKSLNAKLLLIVVLFVALIGVLVGVWQGVVEARGLQDAYNQRLEALSERYRDQIAEQLSERQSLLEAARGSVLRSLSSPARIDESEFDWRRDEDGAWRHYSGHSGVFIDSRSDVTPPVVDFVTGTELVWQSMEPLLATQFSAFYLIGAGGANRVWPASIVAAHQPDHNVREELFYRLATPAENPEREVRWTPIYFDLYPQAWVSSVLAPVYREGEFIAVLGADVEMAFLFRQIEMLESEFSGLEALVFTDDGEVILRSGQVPSAPHPAQFDADSDKTGFADYIAAALEGELTEGQAQSVRVQGEQKMLAFRSIPGMNWSVSLSYPRSMLWAEHRDTMAALYLNVLGMLLLLAFVLYYGIKWLVTDRILALAQATREVGNNDWSLRLPERGQDEISQLSSGINRMLEKINELFRGLNNNIQDMEYLAYYDQLTGLQNRLLFKEQLRTALISAEREQQSLALLYLDLDHFKDINDSLGHEAGDQLLIEVGKRLRRCLRDADSVARLGGDEFSVLLRHVRDERDASEVANKIIAVLAQPIRVSSQEVLVGASIGITLAPSDSNRLDELMKNADLAMYQAKSQGRNIYQFYTSEMNRKVDLRLRLERDLRRALEYQQFELDYQCQMQVSTGRIVGFEGLLRWNHPQLGRVGPDEFIPLAEECGLIVPIGKWVLRSACLQARRLQQAGFDAVKVSINISARQLNDAHFVSDFEQIVAETRAEPGSLVLEVTESTLMADTRVALEHLRAVRALGVGLAIDDFGTGYSSLSYLKRLPVNSLKVDRSFVQDLPDDEEDRAITSLIVAMARSLNYQVIVEGVESSPQLDFLRQCGCDFAQGFYFSRPVSAEQVFVLLAAYNGTDST